MRADGFCYEFDPGFCGECGGKCCTGESGYIWINESEIAKFCEHFGIDKKAFEQKFLIKVGAKFSLKEKIYDDGYACIFFDERDKNCSVYELRPSQCATFPFWDYFKKNLKELKKECIGVKFL
ncbi:YkgJ family cysteine cluster protein [Campylobacter curvus]|uniref:YkgJ family cysteine cluster protein n=1 Tax=Campylobacter curvus TaxID=200 RepID=UPI00146FCA6F|nr:YkgJ family cysteine cluster protein [Campylobacter curvus]